MSLLQVTAQKSKDAVGQEGIFSGQVRVDSGTPQGTGTMEYAEGPIQTYDGDWDDGFWHGQGSCALKNGDTYRGEFVSHERHGNGEYTWVSSGNKQRMYQGTFHHNQRHGHGKYTWKTFTPKDDDESNKQEEQVQISSISTYVGMFDNGQRQGHGVYTTPQIQYTGEWFGGQYHGYGVLESDTGTYKGYFQKGHKSGRGVETSKADGSIVHEGQWVNDRPILAPSPTHRGPENKVSPHHTVVLRNPEPVIDGQGREGLYRGIMQDNLPQGVGTMSYSQHPEFILEYEGFWQLGMKHGFGRVTYMTGDSYQGHLEQNLRQGQGELTTSDARQYRGDFNKNLPHAKENFRVVYANNDMYLGGYENGQRSGSGKFVWNDGGYYKGMWIEGVYSGKGELVTSTTIYKGEFSQGLYHGKGCLTKLSTNEVVHEGEWTEGLPAVEDNSFSNLLLIVPQAPMDYDITQQPVSSAPESYPAPQPPQPSLSSALFGGLTSLVSHEPAAPESPIVAAKSSSPTKSSSSQTPELLDKDACKAVVDMAVSDGQSNPGRYTGILHVKSQRPHGVGRMVYDDGNRVHEGFWDYGHRQGHGRCLFVQIGDFHEGNYDQNLRTGPGTYYWKDGRQFVGTYDKDERQGEGKFTYPNGDCYEGNFQHGQRSGFGVFTFHNKTCQYKGNWESGMYNGSGVLLWQSTREFQNSRLRQICQHRYEGNFVNGLFSGEGIESENNEIIRRGIWNDGKFVEEISDQTSPETNDDQESPREEPSPSEAGTPVEEETAIQTPPETNDDQDTPREEPSPSEAETPAEEETAIQEADENEESSVLNITKQDSIDECPTNYEQSYEEQHAQWKRSLGSTLAEI